MDRRSLIKVAALAPAAPAAALAATARETRAESSGPGRPRYAEAVARLTAYVEAHRRVYALPALTVVATDAEGWRCAIDSGASDWAQKAPLRPDHLFQVGSISKGLLALGVWRAAEAGRLSLDADARPLLPDAPWPEQRITVRNLLEHSSGLPDDAPIFPRGGDGRLWTGSPSGSHWSYSNTGYALLGLIVERAHKRRLGEVLETEVLRPLGMPSARGAILSVDRTLYPASWQPFQIDLTYVRGARLGPAPWVDTVQGAGCVAAPSREMAAWLRWLMDAAGGRGGAGLLPPDKAAAFCRPTIDAPGWATKGARYGNGLATVPANGRSYLHHTGGMVSFNSAFHVDPAAGVGAFASTPVGLFPYRPRAISLHACQLLQAAREGSAWPEPPPVYNPAKLPGGLNGGWTGPDGRVLTIVGERVTLDGVNGRIEPAAPDAVTAVHPKLERYPLSLETRGGRLVGLWSGDTFFALAGVAPPPPAPERLAALAGRYDGDDPWSGGPKRIVARADGLWLDGADRLTALPDGSWRAGDEAWSPERIRFEAPMGGRPQRLVLSGRDFVRRAEPAAL